MKNIIIKIIKKRFYLKYVAVAVIIAVCGVAYCVNRQAVPQGVVFVETDGTQSVFEQSAADLENFTQSTLIQSDYSNHNTDKQFEETEKQTDEQCYIYVCGSVVSPGVYKCDESARVYELIDMAGGFTEEADRNYLNLVAPVEDGQKIYVPHINETADSIQNMQGAALQGMQNNSVNGQQLQKPVNINTADVTLLMTLPGIGEARANDIIAYRTKNGSFKSAEDIMNVSGIKQAAYEKIKDLICVG